MQPQRRVRVIDWVLCPRRRNPGCPPRRQSRARLGFPCPIPRGRASKPGGFPPRHRRL